MLQVEHELDFCTQTHDLVPNGADVPVTSANRQDFVDKYVQFLLTERAAQQFDAFKRGFKRVCDSDVLDMFVAPELEQVVCGVQNVDFRELQRGAHYDGGYDEHSKVVEWFWEVRTTAFTQTGRARPMGSDQKQSTGPLATCPLASAWCKGTGKGRATIEFWSRTMNTSLWHFWRRNCRVLL